MTYNEKKSLYESIMKEVAKTVKHKINEVDNSNEDLKMKRQNMIQQALSRQHLKTPPIDESKKKIVDVIKKAMNNLSDDKQALILLNVCALIRELTDYKEYDCLEKLTTILYKQIENHQKETDKNN